MAEEFAHGGGICTWRRNLPKVQVMPTAFPMHNAMKQCMKYQNKVEVDCVLTDSAVNKEDICVCGQVCMSMQRTDCLQCSLWAEGGENDMTSAHKRDGKDGKCIHQVEHWSKVAPHILAIQTHLCNMAHDC